MSTAKKRNAYLLIIAAFFWLLRRAGCVCAPPRRLQM